MGMTLFHRSHTSDALTSVAGVGAMKLLPIALIPKGCVPLAQLPDGIISHADASFPILQALWRLQPLQIGAEPVLHLVRRIIPLCYQQFGNVAPAQQNDRVAILTDFFVCLACNG